MNIFKGLKTKRSFKFSRMATSDIKATANLVDMTYKTISDSTIVTTAKEIADKLECEICEIKNSTWRTRGMYIIVKSTRANYINFTSDFCKKLGHYLDTVEI